MKFRCRRRKSFGFVTFFGSKPEAGLLPINSREFCAAGPALTRGAGAPCLASRPRNPSVSSAATGATFGVSLRRLRSPLAPLLRSGAAGLLRRLGKPALPGANALAALVFPRCSTSLRLPLTLAKAALCLVSRLRKPFRRRFAMPLVLLRGLRSPLAPLLRSGAAGLLRVLRSHLRCLLAALGALPPHSDFASLGGVLLGHSLCHSRTRLRGHRLRR